LECIKIARRIIRKENLPEGSNSRQAVEDLVWDALDTLKARASEIEVSDNMAQYLRNLEQVGGRVTEYDDDEEEEEEEEEEESDDSDEEENDTGMELDGGEGNMKLQTSQAINITVSSLPAFPYSGDAKALEKSITLPGKLRLPANYGVQHFADPDMAEVNINMRHEDLKLIGLFLLLVLDDPREMEAMVLSYAACKNITITELADMMTNAYGPREKTYEEMEMETQMQTTLPPPALTPVFFQGLALRTFTLDNPQTRNTDKSPGPRELLEGAEAMQEEEQL
jgi:hypothetical protein